MTSLSDIPVPKTLERIVTRVRSSDRSGGEDGSGPSAAGGGLPRSLNPQDIYATLPKSLKSEVLVRSRVEDPEVQRQRRELTQSKSVSELAQVKSLSDFPIPANIEKLIQGRGAVKPPSTTGG